MTNHLPPTSDGPPPTTSVARILLVEDNEAAGRSLAQLLESRGFRVETVRDGTSAMEALATHSPPEFVLTDLQLPDLDGREVAHFARTLDPPPGVMLITGWDLDGARDSPEKYGVDAIFLKPIDIQELVDHLHERLNADKPPSDEP